MAQFYIFVSVTNIKLNTSIAMRKKIIFTHRIIFLHLNRKSLPTRPKLNLQVSTSAKQNYSIHIERYFPNVMRVNKHSVVRCMPREMDDGP